MFLKANEKLSQKFLHSIKIVLFQGQVLGLVAFSHTETNFRQSKLRCLYNILAIFVYIPLISYGVYTTVIIDGPIEAPAAIYITTDVIILVINAVYVVTTWICSIINRDKFIDFMQRLIDFDVKLQTWGITINYQKSRKRTLIRFLIRCSILSSLLPTLAVLTFVDDDLGTMPVESMAYFLLVINSAICYAATELVIMMKARFAILNRQIKNLIEFFAKNNIETINKSTQFKTNTSQLFNLSRICAMHHHLSKLIKLFNEIFGVILLLMFGVSFVVIVITLFYCTARLQSSKIIWRNVLLPLLSNSTFIMNTIWVCDICYSTIQEANRSGELIHKIDTEDHAIRDQIEMFSLQIANEQVEFNAAGFFPVNYTLLFSIIGGVTTYIIILIQLAATLTD